LRRKRHDNRDWHGDASLDAAGGCFAGLAVTLVVALIALGVLKALGAF